MEYYPSLRRWSLPGYQRYSVCYTVFHDEVHVEAEKLLGKAGGIQVSATQVSGLVGDVLVDASNQATFKEVPDISESHQNLLLLGN